MSNQTPGNPFDFQPDQPYQHDDQREVKDVLENQYTGDRYQILEVRYGGMGEVYICENLRKEEPRLALKTFQKRFFFHPASRAAFVREVSVWAQLQGLPHIMPMMGIKYLNSRPFVLMLEAEPGPSGAITIRHLLSQGTLPWIEVLFIVFQVALGMSSAQEHLPGVIHGDLKPENLILIQGKLLFISDFGLARVVNTLDTGGQLESTWAYRASECWDGIENTTPQSDIYAFGIILYELLTGKLPFYATTDEQWKRVHQEQEPQPPRSFPKQGIHKALMSLALRCLEKQAAKRPQGFAAVLDELTQLAELYHPGLLLLRSPIAREISRFQLKEVKTAMIETLLQMDMHELALTELDAMPHKIYDAELWRLRGWALSLSKRDEEALHAFEKALQFNIAEEQRYSYLSDYALSLTHLGRYDEAADIYHSLLSRVPEHMLGMVISNLATVSLDRGRPEDAVRQLETFLKKHPELPHGWANLGDAYQMLGRYTEAMQCFRRTLALAPHMAQMQVRLAGIYMDHFGWIEEAVSALNLAWAQGYNSHEWFVRFMACNRLLDRDEINTHLEQSLTQAKRAEFEAEIHNLVEKIKQIERQKTTSQTPPAVPKVEIPTVTKSQQSMKTSSSEGMGEDHPIAFRAETKVKTPSDSSNSQSREKLLATDPIKEPDGEPLGDQELPLPFHNIRMYLAEGNCSLDFYDDLTALDYVDHFIQAWQQTVRVPQVYLDNPPELRKSPFYFTLCPACGIYILTNRDPGKALRCRSCGRKHQTAPVERDDLTHLLERIAVKLGEKIQVKLGKKDVALCECVHMLCLIHLRDESQMEKVSEICKSAKFIFVPPEDPLAMQITVEASRRGYFDTSRSYSIWQKTSTTTQSHLSSNETSSEQPPEIRLVVRMLQESGVSIRSLSMTYTLEMVRFLEQLRPDNIGKLELQIRQDLQANPNDPEKLSALIMVLERQRKFEEARDKAQVIARFRPEDGWKLLGQIEMSCGRFLEAAQALEKALEVDPVDHFSALRLSHCYQSLGDRSRAAYWANYYQSLGDVV